MISFWTVYFIDLSGFCGRRFTTKEEAENFHLALEDKENCAVIGIRHYSVDMNSGAYEASWARLNI